MIVIIQKIVIVMKKILNINNKMILLKIYSIILKKNNIKKKIIITLKVQKKKYNLKVILILVRNIEHLLNLEKLFLKKKSN